MAAQPSSIQLDPTSDDDGASEFLANRCLNSGVRWIPCPWSALRRVSSLADIRELALSTLLLMQEMSYCHFGGKFPNFRNELGYPRTSWNLSLKYRSVEALKLFVHRTANVCFRFIRMFNVLHVRFTQTVAVNLLDGIVTSTDGMADLMHCFEIYLSQSGEHSLNLNRFIENCSFLLDSDYQFSLEDDVYDTRFDEQDLSKLEIDNVFISRKGGATAMQRDPLIMLKMASMGYIWNTDMESRSLLRVLGPEKKEEIGVWRPLSREERNSLVDAVDENGIFRITGTSTWAKRTWMSHSFMRAQALFERIDNSRLLAVRYIPMPSCELKELDNSVANAYMWHSRNRESWARELHDQLRKMKSMGYSSKHEEVARWVTMARTKAIDGFGWCDGIFEMLFGPINTTYSFACEPTSWERFAELHLDRCMRVFGVKTMVEGVPMYKWHSRQGSDSSVVTLAEKTWRLEPILASCKGRQYPTLKTGWDTSEIWG